MRDGVERHAPLVPRRMISKTIRAECMRPFVHREGNKNCDDEGRIQDVGHGGRVASLPLYGFSSLLYTLSAHVKNVLNNRQKRIDGE